MVTVLYVYAINVTRTTAWLVSLSLNFHICHHRPHVRNAGIPLLGSHEAAIVLLAWIQKKGDVVKSADAEMRRQEGLELALQLSDGGEIGLVLY